MSYFKNGLENYETCVGQTDQINRELQKLGNAIGFRIAETTFNENGNAVQSQELNSRPFNPTEDLKDPAKKQLVRDLIYLSYTDRSPNMDLKPDNLGWVNGKLVLFDFLEEPSTPFALRVYSSRGEGILAQFARGNEQLYRELDPANHPSSS